MSCLYDLYEKFYDEAKGAVARDGTSAMDALWASVSVMKPMESMVASQALEDVEQHLPRHAHIHFCRMHNLKVPSLATAA